MQLPARPLVPTHMEAHHDAKDIRPVAKFPPNIWRDHFVNYTPIDEETKCPKEKEAQELQHLVRNELTADGRNPKERLIYIDSIERLGVAYHFGKDIEDLLKNFHNNSYDDDEFRDDLHYVSLRFRLLRQHGFYTSCDVFNKFKEECGTFKDALTSTNIEDILNFYEATYLKVHGEHILDEALEFTTHQLTSYATQSSSFMATKIKHALKRPLHRCIPRLEAKYQISFYELDPSHEKILLQFARIDFDLLQIYHKQELQEVTRWWRNLDLASKLPFARDRLVECYFWILSMYPEPVYSTARVHYTKSLKMISLMDDIYDAYGTIEELELFTDAIQRWDRNCINNLPNYMRIMYETLLDITNLFENELATQGRSYALHHIQQEWKNLSSAYMQEAKWRHAKYVPTFDEYIRNGIVSSVYLVLTPVTYQCMDIATRKTFEWLRQQRKSMVGTCIIGRVLNDFASYKFEQNREHVATSLECYVKQYSVSKEEAFRKLQELVDDCWKDITDDMLHPTVVEMPLLSIILDLARISNEFYTTDQDAYTKSRILQDKVEALLIDNNNTMI